MVPAKCKKLSIRKIETSTNFFLKFGRRKIVDSFKLDCDVVPRYRANRLSTIFSNVSRKK